MTYRSSTYGCVLALLLACTSSVSAASWQEQLSSAADQLSQRTQTEGRANSAAQTASGEGLSLSTLAGLLNGGNKSLSAGTMSNAAGVLQYCMKQKLVSATNTNQLKDSLLNKLGLNTPEKQPQTQQQDYTQGLSGLLNAGNGQQIDLKSLGNSPLAEKVKTKACDLVLKQGANFLS